MTQINSLILPLKATIHILFLSNSRSTFEIPPPQAELPAVKVMVRLNVRKFDDNQPSEVMVATDKGVKPAYSAK